MSAGEKAKKKQNSTKRVQTYQRKLSEMRKKEMSKKNVERQKLRRKSMSWVQKQVKRAVESDRKRDKEAKRSPEQVKADKLINAVRMQNSRGIKKIRKKFSEQDWKRFGECAGRLPKMDTINLPISELQARNCISTFREATNYK